MTDGYAPAWSSDGSAIYFTRMRGTGEEAGLWRCDLQRNEATRVRAWRRVAYFDIMGERLVYALDDGTAQVFEMQLGETAPS